MRSHHQPMSSPAHSTGLTGWTHRGFFSGLWHLESHIAFLLLLPPAVGLGYYYYYYYFYSCCYRHYRRNPLRYQHLTMQIAVHTEFWSKKKRKRKSQPLLPGGIYALNQKKTGGNQQRESPGTGEAGLPSTVHQSEPPRAGLPAAWPQGLFLLGLLIVTMVPAIHSSHAQSSWDVHGGIKAQGKRSRTTRRKCSIHAFRLL